MKSTVSKSWSTLTIILYLPNALHVVQNIDDDFEDLTKDIRTRLWFTYRRQFSPIGNLIQNCCTAEIANICCSIINFEK